MRWKWAKNAQNREVRWAHPEDVVEEMRVLFWALTLILSPCSNLPIDHRLKSMLTPEGGITGEVEGGVETAHIVAQQGSGTFLVSIDSDTKEVLPPHKKLYTVEAVYELLHKMLHAYEKEYPERANEVQEMLKIYRLPETIKFRISPFLKSNEYALELEDFEPRGGSYALFLKDVCVYLEATFLNWHQGIESGMGEIIYDGYKMTVFWTDFPFGLSFDCKDEAMAKALQKKLEIYFSERPDRW